MHSLVKSVAVVGALLFSMPTQAKECADRASCEFYMNESGDLMRADPGNEHSVKLLAGSGREAMTYGEYVMMRSNVYYLVREAYGNDKSFIIVPMSVNRHDVGFSRILYFSLAMQKSAESGREVWEGSEVTLSKREPIADLSWDRIEQWQGESEPTPQTADDPHIPNGFFAISVVSHSLSGKVGGRRTYLYPAALGATPESVVCFSGCEESSLHLPGVLRGGIGKHPITLTIGEQGDQLNGSYNYDGKTGSLNLDGSMKEGHIELSEHPVIAPAKTTGTFAATMRGNAYIGTWKSEVKGNRLPFFAVMDSL